jgi:hypothetical protein
MHQNMHREVMPMPRLTFTLDEETADRVEKLRARADRVGDRVKRAAASSGPGDRWEMVEKLAQSVGRLGDHPSLAAMVREALFYYLASLEEIEEAARLEAGYRALAEDREREDILHAAARRASDAWSDEP